MSMFMKSIQGFLPFKHSRPQPPNQPDSNDCRPQTHVPPDPPSPPPDHSKRSGLALRNTGRRAKESIATRWIDDNDPMPDEDIELVIQLSPNDPYRTPSLPQTKRTPHAQVKVISTDGPRIGHTSSQAGRRSSSRSVEEGRLMGDYRPDRHGVAIEVRGQRASLASNVKRPRTFRPQDTISNPPVRSIASGNEIVAPSTSRNRDGWLSTSSSAASQLYSGEHPQKRRRTEMSTTSVVPERPTASAVPIPIDVDNDELANNPEDNLPLTMKKIQPESTNKVARKHRTATVTPLDEFHQVEHLVSCRTPVAPLRSTPSLSDKALADKRTFEDTSDEGRFTSNAKRNRQESTRKSESQTPPASMSGRMKPDRTKSDAVKPQSVKEIFGGTSREDTESPDVLQVDNISVGNTLNPSPTPLHKFSNTALANTINTSNDQSGNRSPYFAPKELDGPSSDNVKKLRRKGQKAARSSDIVSFAVKDLCYQSYPKFDWYRIVVNRTDMSFFLDTQEPILKPENPMTTPIKLQKILKILMGQDDSSKVILEMSQSGNDDRKMHLEMTSHKVACDLVKTIQELSLQVKISIVTRELIDKRFLQKEREISHESNATYLPEQPVRMLQDDPPPVAMESSNRNSTHNKPRRLVDRLKPSSRDIETHNDGRPSPHITVVTGRDRLHAGTDEASPANGDRRESNGADPPQTLSGTKLRRVNSHARQTRLSDSRNFTIDDDSGSEMNVKRFKYSQSGQLGPEWKKPLVYPKAGKKRETVEFKDLERLDSDEFLNDNLIGFFLRYLEHYLEREMPEMAKKVYFFNSYFFERLTQTQKGKRGINYDAVEKWTRSVDIFSRDFVVVPVNENLHWYVAIICNLTNIPRKLVGTSSEDDEDFEVRLPQTATETSLAQVTEFIGRGAAAAEAHQTDDRTREILANLSLTDNTKNSNEPDEVVLSDTAPPSALSPKVKKHGPGRRKSARHSLPKHDPVLPVIITLDSLDLGRTSTCTALRQYVVEEGNRKRSFDIDGKAIKGMTAKGIPTQNNFSDCGLFLCAYMEKFVLDPYAFVAKILQREMDPRRDIPVMDSEKLRSRLRDLIINLHRRQDQETTEVSIPDVGKILLGKERIPSPDIQTNDDMRHAGKSVTERDGASFRPKVDADVTVIEGSSTRSKPAERRRTETEPEEIGDLPRALSAINRASPEEEGSTNTESSVILIEDDAPNEVHIQQISHHDSDVESAGFIDFVQDNPSRLAKEMRRQRSPERSQKEQSVSTEYLTTGKSYEFVDDDLKEEVPDSQESVRKANSAHDPQEILIGI